MKDYYEHKKQQSQVEVTTDKESDTDSVEQTDTQKEV